MPDADPTSNGFADSFRRMAQSVLGLAHTRVELFAVELQEEKLRTLNLLTWLSIAVAFGMAGVLVAIAAVALFLWETAGYIGLIGLVLVTLGGAAALFLGLRRRILRGPSPFSETVSEFGKDLECLRRPE